MRTLATIPAVLSALLGGCLSRDLVEWAGEDVAAGALRGVFQSESGPDTVTYDFVTESGTKESRAFLVPGDWLALPRRSWTSEKEGVLVGLVEPILCTMVQTPEGTKGRLHWIDYRLTLGYAVTHDDVGRMPSKALQESSIYGIARFTLEREGASHEIHELYGYDPIDYRWVRLGAVDLGERRGNVPAKVTATVLFLPAVAVDIAGTVVLFFLDLSPSSLHTFGAESGVYAPPPEPADLRQRAIPDLDH